MTQRMERTLCTYALIISTSAWRTSLFVAPTASTTTTGRVFSDRHWRKSPTEVSRFAFLAGDAAAAMSTALAIRSSTLLRVAFSGPLSALLSASTSSPTQTLSPSLPAPSPPSRLSPPVPLKLPARKSLSALGRGGTTAVGPCSPGAVAAVAKRCPSSRAVSCVDTWAVLNAF